MHQEEEGEFQTAQVSQPNPLCKGIRSTVKFPGQAPSLAEGTFRPQAKTALRQAKRSSPFRLSNPIQPGRKPTLYLPKQLPTCLDVLIVSIKFFTGQPKCHLLPEAFSDPKPAVTFLLQPQGLRAYTNS